MSELISYEPFFTDLRSHNSGEKVSKFPRVLFIYCHSIFIPYTHTKNKKEKDDLQKQKINNREFAYWHAYQ